MLQLRSFFCRSSHFTGLFKLRLLFFFYRTRALSFRPPEQGTRMRKEQRRHAREQASFPFAAFAFVKNAPGRAAGGGNQIGNRSDDQATRKTLMRNSALITYVSTETSLALPVKTFSTV